VLNVFWEVLPDGCLSTIDPPDEGQDVWTWQDDKPLKVHVGTKYVILPVAIFPVHLPDTYAKTPYRATREATEGAVVEALAALANAAGHHGDFHVLERWLDWTLHSTAAALHAAIAMVPDQGGPPTQRISHTIKALLGSTENTSPV
jgi:hypothetical protein